MIDNTHLGAPANTATDAEWRRPAPRDPFLSDAELDAVTGGLNPQPLPPRIANWGVVVLKAPTLTQLEAFAAG